MNIKPLPEGTRPIADVARERGEDVDSLLGLTVRELRERGYIISGYEGAVFQKHADSPTGYIIQAPPWIDTATGKFLPEVAKFYLAH